MRDLALLFLLVSLEIIVALTYAKEIDVVGTLVWSEGFRRFKSSSALHYRPSMIKPLINSWPTNSSLHEILLIGGRVWTFPNDFDTGDVKFIYRTFDDVRVQNLDRSKLTHKKSLKTIALPLGIDLHTLEQSARWGHVKSLWRRQHQEIVELRRYAPELKRRKRRVLVTWTSSSQTSWRHRAKYKMRTELYSEALNSTFCDFVEGSRSSVWGAMTSYAFVFAPIGNGYDTHRLWEALALGCIVIAQRNPTTAEFSELFPIVLVEDMYEITIVMLNNWASTMHSTELYDLRLARWLGRTFL